MKLTMCSVRVTQQIRTNGPTLGEEEEEEEKEEAVRLED